ncbi:MAG: hypothetical protein LPK58_04035 [Gammaproteobacteria bacterium]|nr:hypothetical protein [Gammaproteobacteria bacterium]MDX5374852.1 hypothetical protein [Gammaproteobacteria bacterium]
MYKLIVIALLAGGLYYSHENGHLDGLGNFMSADSGEIRNPVYARLSVDIRAEGREIEGIAFGKMRSQAECEQRTQQEMRDMIRQCPQCEMSEATCTDSLAKRELAYFAQRPTHLTYLYGRPGSRDEREFAMIFWGLTVEEARMLCTMVEQGLSREYSGELSCIREHDV